MSDEPDLEVERGTKASCVMSELDPSDAFCVDHERPS